MRVPIRKPDKYTHHKSDPRLTVAKVTELEEKLQRLQQSRPRLAKEVQLLSETGDFSENAGYQAAKGRLRGLNQKILEIEDQLKNAKVITPPQDTSTVKLGHRVTIDIAGKQYTYHILGSSETNPSQGVISHNSPIGAALIGRRVGDEVTFQTAAKVLQCKIIKIT